MHKGISRVWLGVAIVAALAFGFAAVAGGKTKTKTYSSGTINQEFGDFETATHDFDLNKKSLKKSEKFKAARVKDVNVGVRTTSPCSAVHELELTGPNGARVVLAEPPFLFNNCGDGYGSGSASCSGSFAVLDDEAGTPVEEGILEGGPSGTFRPEESLAEFDGIKVKGVWRFEVTDTDGEGDSSTLHCVELEIKYKRKKKH